MARDGTLRVKIIGDSAPFEQTMGRLGGIAGTALLGVGAAIAGVAAAGIREFASMERGMNEVFTLMPGISENAMGAMTEDVREFSREMGTSTDEVVPALYQALSAGVPQDNVFDFMETANKAALGGVTDLETAVDGISSVMNAYGEDVVDAAEASDLMFTAVRLGKTDFDQLSSSLFNVVPTASSLGVEFGDVTAALANLTAQGTPTTVATTQLRQMFVELSKEGGKASGVFEEMAGQTFQEFIAEGGNTADALDLMREAAEESGVGLADMFGSVEAGQAALGLAADDTEGYRDALDEMSNAAGATDAAHEQMDQGLSRAWERIKTNVTVALGEIGERLAPTFEEFATWISENMPAITDFIVGAFEAIAGFVTDVLVPAFQNLSAWWDENGERIIGNAQALWAGIQAAFDGIAAVVSWVVGLFQSSSGETSATMQKLQATFQTVWEAISLVVSGAAEQIGTIIGWIQAAWTRWGDTIMAHASTVWNAIQDIIGGVLDIIRGVFETFIGVFTGDWERAWEGVKTTFSGIWDAIVGVFEIVWSTIETVLTVGLDIVRDLWDTAWTAVRDKASEIWDNITSSISEKIDEVVEWMRELPGRITGAIGDLGSLLWDEGRAILQGLWDGMVDIWNNLTGWVGGLGGRIADLKGPIEKDRKLLVGEGMAIMEGFGVGLGQGWEDVQRQLSAMTAQVPTVAARGMSMPSMSMGGRVAGGDGLSQTSSARRRADGPTRLHRDDLDYLIRGVARAVLTESRAS